MLRKSVLAPVSIVMLFGLLILSTGVRRSEAWSGGVIYIRADGSVEPADAPIRRDGDTYTLTDNIYSNASGVIIERDNMTIDGANRTVHGSEFGISLDGRSNITIRKIEIRGSDTGIHCESCSEMNICECSIVGTGEYVTWGIFILRSTKATVCGNTITNNERGLQIYDSSGSDVYGNNITANNGSIHISSSNNITLIANTIVSSSYGIYHDYSNYDDIVSNNVTVSNGRALTPAGLFWFMAVGALVMAFCVPIANVSTQTIRQMVVPMEMQGRVNSVTMALASAATPLGMILSGVIVEFTRTANLFLGCAITGVLILTLSWLFTDMRQVEKLEQTSDQQHSAVEQT